MALLGFEGFDSVNGPTDLTLGPLTSILGGTSPTINTVNARTGSGNCLALNGTTSPGMQLLRATGTGGSTIIIGAALLTLHGRCFIGAYNGSTCQASFACDSGGNLAVYRGDPTTGTVLANGATIAYASIYNYFELQVTVGSGTSGSITARLNGAVVVNLGSTNTSVDGTSIINQIGIGSTYTTAGVAGYVDDLYFADATGGAPYNTFLGDVHVTTMMPSANVSTSWTPSSGTNWQAVSETAMDADSSYNVTAVPGQTDLFATTGISSTPTSIYGVQVKMATRQESSGGDQIAGVVSSNSVVRVGSSQPVLPSYTYIDQIFTTDPNTNAAWTKAGVNAAQFGYKRIS